MGVRGLETFLEDRQPCHKAVNIGQLALEYKKTHKKNPEIVLDFTSCIVYIKGIGKPWVGGWQIKEFIDNLEKLVEKFKEFSIDVTVFIDGKIDPFKVEHWLTKRKDRYNDVNNIYSSITTSKTKCGDKRDHGRMYPGNLFKAVVDTLNDKKCKVFQSIITCDVEVADYAKKNECFAILAQESDFAIFNSADHYFSMKKLNLSTLDTIEYDSNGLANELKLELSGLRFLATLMGNSYIDPSHLRLFHDKLTGGGRLLRHAKFYSVAKFINLNNINITNYPNKLASLSEMVFGDVSKALNLQKSIESYNLNEPHCEQSLSISDDEKWAKIQKFIIKQHKYAKIPRMIFSIALHSIYFHEVGLENMTWENYMTKFDMVKKLRQMIYGILFQDKPQPVGSVQEVYVDKNGKWSENAEPIKPKRQFDILKLMTDTKTKPNWDLFCSTLDIESDKVSKIKEKHLLIPIISLKYLMMEGLDINDWELNAIVASILMVKSATVEKLRAIWIHNMDPKGVDLYWFLMRVFDTMDAFNSVCGSPIKITNPVNFQDGNLFQDLYLKSKNEESLEDLLDNQMSLVQAGKKLIAFIKETESNETQSD